MNNKKKKLGYIIIALLFVLTLISCKKESNYKIIYNSNGGNEIPSFTGKENEKITLPIPVKEGYEFLGWYKTSDFSDDSITTVTLNEDVNVYAKWVELIKIELDLDGGVLDKTCVYGKAGDTLLDLVENLKPTKTDLTFGCWTLNNLELTSATKITNKPLSLKAKYKAEYTINLFKQNFDLNDYTKETKTYFDYVGKVVEAETDLDGFIYTLKPETIDEITISENKSLNVLNLYFDREEYIVTLRSNYPNNSKEDETQSIKVLYGDEVELPNANFELEGYYLLGYALSEDGELVYNAHYIDNLPYNLDEPIDFDKELISTDRNISLYAVWNKGYKDMFGGSDYIFIAPDNETMYLYRGGVYFIGEFYEEENSFILYNDFENIEGIVYDDLTFAYYNVSRSEFSASLYTVGSGVDNNEKILFDAYNGITYSSTKSTGLVELSKGTYFIDEDGYYQATFTEGPLEGQTLVLSIGSVNIDGGNFDAFQLRNEEEIELGNLVRFLVHEGRINYYVNAYDISLSGFGTLKYNLGDKFETYYYSLDKETDVLTINDNNGNLIANAKLITVDGIKGYMVYNDDLNHEFVDELGGTLTLDGLYTATYEYQDTLITGTFSQEKSLFGGYIITVSLDNGDEKIFLTSTKEEQTLVGSDTEDETIITYHFTSKPNGYEEFYYRDDNNIYYAPLVVLNDDKEGEANVYGYTSNKTYELVLSGIYEYLEDSKLYVFTKTKYYPKDVHAEPVNYSKLTSFVFGVDKENTQYRINFWYESEIDSVTKTYNKDYTGTNGAKLTLVQGIAIYLSEGHRYVGTYEIEDSLLNIKLINKTSIYLELDEDNKTFIALEYAPYKALIVKTDGTYSDELYLNFDGRGNAEYVYFVLEGDEKIKKSIKGIIETTEDFTREGLSIYKFTSDEKTFTYLRVEDSNQVYIFEINNTYSGNYSSEDGLLYLDGYIYKASYTDMEGNVFTGTYSVDKENFIKIVFDDNKGTRYFDIIDREFVIRGFEYGQYTLVDNGGMLNKYIELDGFDKAIVYYFDNNQENKVIIDDNGSYIIDENNKIEITYKDNLDSVLVVGFLSTKVVDEETYPVIKIEHNESVRVYLNERDWSLLKLDSIGNALMVDNKGKSVQGSYILISDSLLYFESDDKEIANIYKYNNQKLTIQVSKFTARGYYTADLKSLLFSQYGFAIFNNETKYYYAMEGDDVIIYHQDPSNADANEYGFVKENFGEFDEIKEYKGLTYYSNDGYAISFEREEETKEDYPVLINENDKKPLTTLVFTPSGSDEFSVSGSVKINSNNYQCIVSRVYIDGNYKMYVQVGSYKFEIVCEYSGKDNEGNTDSKYKVVGMTFNTTYHSFNYLNTLYYYYLFYGSNVASTYENNHGVVEIKKTYNNLGDEIENYIVLDFKEETKAFDLNGESLKRDKVSYEENEKYFVAHVDGSDGYEYRIYLLFTYVSQLNSYAYKIQGITKVEKLTDDLYELYIERITYTEANYKLGAVMFIGFDYDNEEIKVDEAFTLNDTLTIVSREYNDIKAITQTYYYQLSLTTDEDVSLDPDVVKPYKTVEVTKVNVTTKYSADSTSYVDIMGDKITFVCINNIKYVVSECSYTEETKTYKIRVTSMLEYTVKLNDDGTVTLEIVNE